MIDSPHPLTPTPDSPLPGVLCITHIFLKHCAIASRSGGTERNCVVQVSTIAGLQMRSGYGMGLPDWMYQEPEIIIPSCGIRI
ncbi:hypothetical protein MC7420_4473 [Coleofasciculus chthonoplastes PCC 7420]|uniref:Uncharacterized protein n=1 Tax=Coleofasciculus chthonoplastes PCC 7420 TaxID=118168 RepID=B4VY44_9CYAN|nr:hypothetical protein MC7420_4473 [Coleofasciculus chthonoplastes PCC 7420]